jgi:flagellar motor switch protein FliG
MISLAEHEPSRPLDGVEKVAAVLLALDRDASSRVLKHFDQQELRKIARVAATLGAIPSALLEEICAGMVGEIAHGGIDLIGDVSVAEDLLANALPDEQVADIMSDVRGTSNKFLWRRVAALPDQILAGYLSNEHPQTVAVVVSKLDAATAANVLALVPGEVRAQALRRMLTSKPVSEAVLRVMEEAIQEDLFIAAAGPSTTQVSAHVAGIVNQLEREQIESILNGIAETEPVLAAQLKALLFTFDDIVRLSQRARMLVFDQVSTEKVIVALRGADASMKDAVLPCLSARTRRMVEAELSSGADSPKKEITAAQREIANLVLRLADQGHIDLSTEVSEPGG